jgi:mevalonate kinase
VGGVGRGQGKLLLFGEHAAVYGHPAVGLSLPEGIRAEVEVGAGSGWELCGVRPDETERLRELLALFGRILPELGEGRGGLLRVDSSLPRGVGFGSSGALCGALAKALTAALRPGSSPGSDTAVPTRDARLQRVWELAHEAERLFHGTPSGIDTGLALLGGLHRFLPQPPGLPRAQRLRGFPMELVIGAVPRAASGGSLIAGLRERVLDGDRATRRRLSRLGGLALAAAAVLEAGEAQGLEELGRLATQAQELLAALGLSTPELELLLGEGLAAGALGGKLSGAGGGGAFYLLYDRPETAEAGVQRLRRACARAGLTGGCLLRRHSWPEEGKAR